MKKSIAWAVCCFVCLISFTGCAIHAVDVQTLTIPPQKEPVTVTVKGIATCQDNFFTFRVYENLEISSSNGQKAQRVVQ